MSPLTPLIISAVTHTETQSARPLMWRGEDTQTDKNLPGENNTSQPPPGAR